MNAEIDMAGEPIIPNSKVHPDGYHLRKINPLWGRLVTVGATAFRLMLCPGDDILAVTSVVTVGINNHSEQLAALPYRGSLLIEGDEETEDGEKIKVFFRNLL